MAKRKVFWPRAQKNLRTQIGEAVRVAGLEIAGRSVGQRPGEFEVKQPFLEQRFVYPRLSPTKGAKASIS